MHKHMYTYIRICIYIDTHTCISMYILHTHLYTDIYTPIYVYIYTYTYIHIHIYIYRYMHVKICVCMHSYTHVCIHIYTYVYVCMYMRLYVCINVCMHVFTNLCMYICICVQKRSVNIGWNRYMYMYPPTLGFRGGVSEDFIVFRLKCIFRLKCMSKPASLVVALAAAVKTPPALSLP